MQGNRISGSIPSTLGRLTALTLVWHPSRVWSDGDKLPRFVIDCVCSNLDLSLNQLDGTVPFTFGLMMSLSYLNVDFNRITEVPQSILSMTALRCAECGKVPYDMQELKDLLRHQPWLYVQFCAVRTLSLCNNSFTGSTPAFLRNATWITYVR